MFEHLSLDDFLELAKSNRRIAIYHEIQVNNLTPTDIVERLPEEMATGVLLESGLCDENLGRYSFIMFNLLAELSVKDHIVTQQINNKTIFSKTSPFDSLRQLSAKMSCLSKSQAIDFLHGGVGFITYDGVRLFEDIPNQQTPTDLPQMQFNFYQTTLVFDHLKQTLLISMNIEVGEDAEQTYRATQEKIEALIEKIMHSPERNVIEPLTQSESQIETDINDEQFMQLVKYAKQYIIAGDVFQIVLSRCFRTSYSHSPLDIYRALCKVTPAPYLFYFPINDSIIIGASPEKMVSLFNRCAEITPIAGTRKRSAYTNDDAIEKDLLNDKKEQAEHMMLVDLARNDLGAVCVPGSVQVKELLRVKHFSHVSHITSLVTGELRDGFDAFDLLAAAFPAGTLSGAPKIRAMEIIDELETSQRGMYGGAICRFDFHGNFDSCIAIRMAVLKEGIATVRAGAGIVFDSDPEAEANETRQKAKGVLDAILFAQDSINDSNN